MTGDYDPDPGGVPHGIDGVGPHVNFTGQWGVEGVDLGANTEHAGKLFVFFGDVPQPGDRQWPPHDADLVAWVREPNVWPGALRLEPVVRDGVFHPFSVRLNEPAADDPVTLAFGAQQHVFYRVATVPSTTTIGNRRTVCGTTSGPLLPRLRLQPEHPRRW